MPDTTGGRFGPTEEQEKLNRQLAVQSAMLERQRELQAHAASLKPETAQPQAKAPMSREMQALGRARLAGTSLGSPESWGGMKPLQPAEAQTSRSAYERGEQDFYQPIPVTRGMTTTYQGPKYGEEFAGPGQAAQAFRRAQGAGEYIPAEEKSPEARYKIKRADMELNVRMAQNRLTGTYPEEFAEKDEKTGNYVRDEKTGLLSMRSDLIPLWTKHQPELMTNPKEAEKNFTNEAMNFLFTKKYGTGGKRPFPEILEALQNYETKNKNKPDAETLKRLDRGINKVNQKDMEFYRKFLIDNGIPEPPTKKLSGASVSGTVGSGEVMGGGGHKENLPLPPPMDLSGIEPLAAYQYENPELAPLPPLPLKSMREFSEGLSHLAHKGWGKLPNYTNVKSLKKQAEEEYQRRMAKR